MVRFTICFQETFDDGHGAASAHATTSTMLDPRNLSHTCLRLKPLPPREDPSLEYTLKTAARGSAEERCGDEVRVMLPTDRKTWHDVVFEVEAPRVALAWRVPGLVHIKAASSSAGRMHTECEVSGSIMVFPELERLLYRVHVFTGDLPRASTSAKISVILTGEHGRKTNAEQLRASRVSRSGRPSAFNAFGRNKEAVCEFEALDIGAVSEVLLWQNSGPGVQADEWYLHRVEVLALNRTTLEEKSRRTFLWRKWLSPFREANGTQAKLVYEDVKHLEKLPATYGIKLALPRALAPNRSNLLATMQSRGSFAVCVCVCVCVCV